MRNFVSRSVAQLNQEPVRELLKFKYRHFRFRGLASLLERVQPKYKRRLKWQIVDAALQARSDQAITELEHIFATVPEPLNGLFAPLKSFLSGYGLKARQEARDIADDKTLAIELRTGAFFLGMVMNSPCLRQDGECQLFHFQYWDNTPPRDVVRLLDSWKGAVGSPAYRFFDDTGALDFIKANFEAGQVKAYENCQHPSAKTDLVRFCALYHFGGTYSDADCAPQRDIRTFRRSLTERPTFWIASDLDFHARTWFLASPPKAKIFEHFIVEATKRSTGAMTSMSLFDLAGPGLVRDVLFQNRNETWVNEQTAGFTSFFGEAHLVKNANPNFKQDGPSSKIRAGARAA